MQIIFLIISHFFALLLGLFTNRWLDKNTTSNTIRKILSKKAEIIDPTDPLDSIEI